MRVVAKRIQTPRGRLPSPLQGCFIRGGASSGGGGGRHDVGDRGDRETSGNGVPPDGVLDRLSDGGEAIDRLPRQQGCRPDAALLLGLEQKRGGRDPPGGAHRVEGQGSWVEARAREGPPAFFRLAQRE